MDVSHHVVAVPKNRGGHYLICNVLASMFIFFYNLILLKPELIEYLFQGQNLSIVLMWTQCLIWSVTNIKP